MNKLIVCAGFVVLLDACAVAPSVGDDLTSVQQRFDFYVSPHGDDGWSGRLAEPNESRSDGPFLTLAKAKDAVRAARGRQPQARMRVALRGGTYRLQQTLVYSLDDSANDGGSTAYMAYPGEMPIVSSGVPLSAWQRFDSNAKNASAAATGHLWVVNVPAGLDNVLTLYDGLQRLPRARSAGFTPPRAWKEDAAGRGPADIFYFPPGQFDRYADIRGADLLVMPTANYEMNILAIAHIERERQMGVTGQLASRPMGPMQFHSETMWVENRLEDLDAPGEWVFSAQNHTIVLWPIGERPSAHIVAPALTELVRVEGNIDYAGPTDEPVKNLRFEGITFAHAERWPWPGQDGFDLQHSWEHFDCPSALVRLRGAENCAFQRCRFVASGGAGARLDLYCQHNRLDSCEFAGLGGVGVLLAGYGPGTKDVNRENTVTNNWVHHIGEVSWASPAIFAWQSGTNQIANNLIHNTPYTGIVVSGRIGWNRNSKTGSVRTIRWQEIGLENPPWSWAAREPYLHGRLNRVERNEIHDVMERLGDGNAIYVSGTGRGNIVRENYIHDGESDHVAGLIRCDDDQEETIIEKNVIYNARSMHQAIIVKGKNDICNNLLVNLRPSRLKIDPRWQLHGYIGLEVNPVAGSHIQHNVVYATDPTYTPFIQNRTYGRGAEPLLRECDCDFNLYYSPADANWAQPHFDAERQFGIEQHSVSADPMFVDVEHGDLRFRKDSPAFNVGIEPIAFEKIGLLPEHPYYQRPESDK
ncbi:MAG: right-handed parallel beta-helix repeat-containing protein [Pirellulales bacterium]